MTTERTRATRWRRELGWHPRDLGWRIGALFMVGSALFALGSLPAYAAQVDHRVAGGTFFVGSIFFTSAAYSQFYEQINRSAPNRRFWAVQRSDLGWWATVVQLFGTLMFNVSTLLAMAATLTDEETNRLVWGPDMFGSVAFLVASHLAWLMVEAPGRAHDDDRRIARINYLGSIFFMVSAVASVVLPTTGEVLSLTLVNSMTFGGAVCFFLGAYLLLPARTDA